MTEPVKRMTREEIIAYVRPLAASYFKDEEGKPVVLSDSQCLLFDLIYRKPYHRVHIEAHTRFGKSMTIAMAILLRVTTFPEKWAIVAGNTKQAQIIMSYMIAHIFDHSYFRSKFIMEDKETAESIRRYRNKDRVNFNVEKDKDNNWLLGEVFVTNAAGAMGFGAPNVVGDESALVPDDEEVLINRMLGDNPTENFYMKVGNPWDSGHFDQSREDPKYHKMIIDYRMGIAEGRFTVDQALEMMKKPFFGVLYECKRPPLGMMDEQGWMPLLTREDIDRRIRRVPDVMADHLIGFGLNKIGGDVAGGGKNFSVMVQRWSNAARMIHKSHDPDTMNFGEALMGFRERFRVSPWEISIDRVGLGKGVYDILYRQPDMSGIKGINAGDKIDPDSPDAELYYNLRALMYWRLRQWILNGGNLLALDGEDLNETWYQLTKVYYRKKLEGMRGKIQIMPKEIALKRGIQSPDVADALSLTFDVEDVVSLGNMPSVHGTSEGGSGGDPFGITPSL